MKQHTHHYVYRIVRSDGKYYIGVHSTDYLDDDYLGSGKVMKRSLKKHGATNHSKQIIMFHETRALAMLHEGELVNEQTLQDPNCMNIIRGGGGTYDTSKISAALKGRPQPKSVCEAISKRRKGVPTWGRPIVIEGVEYKSAAEAARILGISARTITTRCRRMSVSGWRYADQEELIRPDRKHPKSKSVMVDGVLYDKVTDVENALGCCRRTIKIRCESDEFPTWNYVNSPKT